MVDEGVNPHSPEAKMQTNYVIIWMVGLKHQYPFMLSEWYSCTVSVRINCISRKAELLKLAKETPLPHLVPWMAPQNPLTAS